MRGHPSPPPSDEEPRSFQGWQRGACLVGVALIVLLGVYVMVVVAVGVLTGH